MWARVEDVRTKDTPVRINRKAVLWTGGDLDDLSVIQTFYENYARKSRMSDFYTMRVERHTWLIFRVEHSPPTRDDVLAGTTVTELAAFTAAHRIDYLSSSEMAPD
jgi:hypothetical protein